MSWNHLLLLLLLSVCTAQICQNPCYNKQRDTNCNTDPNLPENETFTLHMTVHPHLDAFWIFDFDGYYDPPQSRYDIWSYFSSNRFATVKDIFTSITTTLNNSLNYRRANGQVDEKARRSFVNSEMGFFKHWYMQQNNQVKDTVKELLKTKYWEILGGGFVENDEAAAYYDDIIDQFQLGSHFLEKQFGYIPKAAVSADSFGHSQSMAAILSHMGIEGFLVERSDEHILEKQKLQYIWRPKSANGRYYGAIPTHIRWTIHGYEQQFVNTGNVDPVCQTKNGFIEGMRMQNNFLKRLFKQNHVMRYFGHDFQKFDQYSFSVIEAFMKQFRNEKCERTIATYTNPTEYFKILYRQVYEKLKKPIKTRDDDIFPIWDYDSGLYWTGYFTTDPYHKKIYRDAGRFLQIARKLFVPLYLADPHSVKNIEIYEKIERLEEVIAYLQHHDGITCTSKYNVLDKYEDDVISMEKNLRDSLFTLAFKQQFPQNADGQTVFTCELDEDCVLPANSPQTVLLNVFNSGGQRTEVLKIHLPHGVYYQSVDYKNEIICMCYKLPCNCTLYITATLGTFTSIELGKFDGKPQNVYTLSHFSGNSMVSYNDTTLILDINGRKYTIAYKRVVAEPTPRNYDHLNAMGNKSPRSFTIRSGKYALGNNPNKIYDFSRIDTVSVVETPTRFLYLVEWGRAGMRTLLSVEKQNNKVWNIDTLSAAESYKLNDYYLVVGSPIRNGKVFYTDSNGWLVTKRTMFHHDDYQAFFSKERYDDIDGNTYPITAFAYIEDNNDKMSINTDRGQGCIAHKQGQLWVNFDRLSSDDGKWVWQTTYRSEYQRFRHVLAVQNNNNMERAMQKIRDEGLFIRGSAVSTESLPFRDPAADQKLREAWNVLTHIDQVKFHVRMWNDSTLLLRVQNLNDKQTLSFSLFASNISTFLTSYYGQTFSFTEIYETTIAGNQKYEDFIKNKWNWNKLIDLREQNAIFNKNFSEQLTLGPLEIRAFKLVNPKIEQNCISTSELRGSGIKRNYVIDTQKEFDQLDKNPAWEYSREYLINGNHCTGVLESKPVEQPKQTQPPKPIEQPKQTEPPKPVQPPTSQPPKPQPTQTHQQVRPQPEMPTPSQTSSSSSATRPTHPVQQTNAEDIIRAPLPTKSFAELKKMVNNQILLSYEEKQQYFKQRIIELKAENC